MKKRKLLVIGVAGIALILSGIMTIMSMPQQTFVLATSGFQEWTYRLENDRNSRGIDTSVESYAIHHTFEDEWDEDEIIAEVIEKRTETSKTFVQADGTYVFWDFGIPIHREINCGEFVEMFNSTNSNRTEVYLLVEQTLESTGLNIQNEYLRNRINTTLLGVNQQIYFSLRSDNNLSNNYQMNDLFESFSPMSNYVILNYGTRGSYPIVGTGRNNTFQSNNTRNAFLSYNTNTRIVEILRTNNIVYARLQLAHQNIPMLADLRLTNDINNLAVAPILWNELPQRNHPHMHVYAEIDITRYLNEFFGFATLSFRARERNRTINFGVPNLIIRYRPIMNDENIIQNMGLRGTGMINLYSGMMSYVYDTVFIDDGSLFPISINHIYTDITGNDFYVGNNFRLNLHKQLQTVDVVAGTPIFRLVDGFGRKFYFSEYYRNRELGLTHHHYNGKNILVDRQGNSMVFRNGSLLQMHQFPSSVRNSRVGMHLNISYVGNQLNQIHSVTNGITTINFEYQNARLKQLSYSRVGNNMQTSVAEFLFYNSTNRLDGIRRLTNQSTNSWHITGFQYTRGINDTLLGRIFDRDNINCRQKLAPHGEDMWYFDVDRSIDNRIGSFSSRPDGRENTTVNLEYIDHTLQNLNADYGVTRTTILRVENTQHFRHVSFNGRQLIGDYAFEIVNENKIMPLAAWSNGFDYFTTQNTFGAHEIRRLNHDGNISNTNTVNISFSTQHGTFNHAVSMWVRVPENTTTRYLRVDPNGNTGGRKIYEINARKPGWQFVTINLRDIANLNSIRVSSNDTIFVRCITVTRLPQQLTRAQFANNFRPDFLRCGALHRSFRLNPATSTQASTITMNVYELEHRLFMEIGGVVEMFDPMYPRRIMSVREFTFPITTSKENMVTASLNRATQWDTRTVFVFGNLTSRDMNINRMLTSVRVYGRGSLANSGPPQITSFTYNNGRLISVTDPNGVRTQNMHNANGSITNTITGTGSSGNSPNVVRTDTLQQSTRLLMSTQIGNVVTRFGYTASGALSSIHHNNFYTNFDYHPDGNLLAIRVPSRTLATFSHTENSDTVAWGNNQTVIRNFDDSGRLTNISGSNGFNATVIHYGINNRNVQILHSTGVHYWHEIRDNNMHVTAIRNGANVEVQNSISYCGNGIIRTNTFLDGTQMIGEEYIFNQMGQIASINRHGRHNVTYSYNNMHQLQNRTIRNYKGATLESRFAHTNQRITSERFYVNNQLRNEITYIYYANGNVRQVFENGVLTSEYVFDNLNRLIRHYHTTNRRDIFTYDAGGNITRIRRYERRPNSTLWNILSTDTFTYSANGWRDLQTRINGQTITHDAIGNPIRYRSSGPGLPQIEFEWQNGRQLRQIRNACRGRGLGTVTMEYDYLGRRTRKINNQWESRFFWDGDRLIGEQRLGEMIWYYHDDQGVSGMRWRGNDYHFRRNMFGDVLAIYNSRGELMGTYEYDAWGNHTNDWDIPGSVMRWNPWRWRGYFWDEETGFYYLGSRFYDPETGRFLNADEPTMLFLTSTMGNGGANLFAYALNNPVMNYDPTGYFAQILVGAGVKIAAAMVAVVAVAIGVAYIATMVDTQSISDSMSDWWNGIWHRPSGGGAQVGTPPPGPSMGPQFGPNVAFGPGAVGVGLAGLAGYTFLGKGLPGNNRDQNEQFRSAMRKLGIRDKSDWRWRFAHDNLPPRHNMGYNQLLEFLRQLFGMR